MVKSLLPLREITDPDDLRILGKLVVDSSTKEAYLRLLSELMFLKTLDKKKWQHKPSWKVTKLFAITIDTKKIDSMNQITMILKNVFEDAEEAKTELGILFQVKSVMRSFINFWRPEFERYVFRAF